MTARLSIVIVGAILLWLPGCGGDDATPPGPSGAKPIALRISGSYPPFRWELRVDPAGRAIASRSRRDEPETSKAVSISADDLAEIHEQLEAADFRSQRFERSCLDCPIYTLTYGQAQIKADLLSIPGDVEAPIRKLEQLGGDPLGSADALPTR